MQQFVIAGGGVVVNWEDFPETYQAVHDAVSGRSVGNGGYIGQLRDEYGWLISRGYVTFETRQLPQDSAIVAAILSIPVTRLDKCQTNFNIIVQKGSHYRPNTQPTKADFDHRYYSGDGGSQSTAGLVIGYNDIELNNDGLSWIKKAGEIEPTKFCLRSSRDISSTPPSGVEMVGVCLGLGCQTLPLLTVTLEGGFNSLEITDIAVVSMELPGRITDRGKYQCQRLRRHTEMPSELAGGRGSLA